MSKKTLTEIIGVLSVAYLATVVYSYTGNSWFARAGNWGAPLPLLVILIPLLVVVIGPGSRKLYDKAARPRGKGRSAESRYDKNSSAGPATGDRYRAASTTQHAHKTS